ncbi:uncharacterized protein N7483_011056 [Penicillium malachiteum]|uniref:uncharacterized protein n=1 Tax=Penicillium malachiteum TaxID=1324776 RepID=UPI002549422C|nr:uncharacterized protein N7483_011056 [Penicillium malachiteum]KAJ5713875.1 hypothetical protein N7483_011056 [Penicillium malachiteum]
MSAESSSWSSVQKFLENSDIQTVDYFQRTKWDELCRTASGPAGDLECIALDQVASGLNNIVRVLHFSDQTRWAARVHIRRKYSSFDSSINFEAEVGTMQFIKEHSDLPVPRLFAYEADENNPVGVAFMLIELLPGIVAMDPNGGYEVHRGMIPKEYRPNFYSFVAKYHVHLTSLRLPKIGTIIRNHEGGYESGPIP